MNSKLIKTSIIILILLMIVPAVSASDNETFTVEFDEVEEVYIEDASAEISQVEVENDFTEDQCVNETYLGSCENTIIINNDNDDIVSETPEEITNDEITVNETFEEDDFGFSFEINTTLITVDINCGDLHTDYSSLVLTIEEFTYEGVVKISFEVSVSGVSLKVTYEIDEVLVFDEFFSCKITQNYAYSIDNTVKDKNLLNSGKLLLNVKTNSNLIGVIQ